MTSLTKHGYLVLADISGYTSYLSRVELEHAQEILADLLGVVVEHFKQVLTISKLEGDAVFANIDEAQMASGERLLELIENTYFTFRRRRDACQNQTTCTCRACQAIQSLDLKFFVHYGDFMDQTISGIHELVGSDVNLIHRLTKNHIREATGWRAYILFTQKALEHINLAINALHAQTETYEHLGDVATLSMDIHPRYDEMTAAVKVIIPPQDADYTLVFDFVAPPFVMWDWVTDVRRRSQALGEHGQWSIVARPGGRSGAGARNHCAHGKGEMDEIVLDWHPFEYATSMKIDGKVQYQDMYIFHSTNSGQNTRVELRMKILKPPPLWLSRQMVKIQFFFTNPYLDWFKTIKQLMEAGPN